MDQSLTSKNAKAQAARHSGIDMATVKDGVYKLTSPVLMALFFVSLSMPVPFSIGTTQLSPDRLFLTLLFIPIVIRFLSRKAGPFTKTDIMFCLFGFWMMVSLLKNNGFQRFPYAAVSVIEMSGAYLLGRVLVRNRRDFEMFMASFFVMLILMLPFVIPEFLTSKAYLLEIFRSIFGVSFSDLNHSPRMGFERAQAVFEHPILFGVFCSFGVSNAIFIFHRRKSKAYILSAIALFMTFSSLSAGAFLAAVLQVFLLLWGKITGNKWKTCALIFLAFYIFLSIASNRGPIIILIQTLAFNPESAWTRVVQYNHGSAVVLAHPVFGIGLNDWSRPGWLGPSVDNFWLLMAMRYGLIGFVILAAAFGFHIRNIVKAINISRESTLVRTGYIISLISVIFSMATVHLWGPTNAFVMAYLGAGAWLYTQPTETASADEPEDKEMPTSYQKSTRKKSTVDSSRTTSLSYTRKAFSETTSPTTKSRKKRYTRGSRK